VPTSFPSRFRFDHAGLESDTRYRVIAWDFRPKCLLWSHVTSRNLFSSSN
jgi:hypothetical protein